MKINIYFRGQLRDTGTLRDGSVVWERGPGRIIAQHYERQGYRGEELLNLLLERLRGNTWAEKVEE